MPYTEDGFEAQQARQQSIWESSPEAQELRMQQLQMEAADAYDPASGYSEREWFDMYMANKGQNNTRQWSQPAQEPIQQAPVRRAPLAMIHEGSDPRATGRIPQDARVINTTQPGWYPETQELKVRY